MPRLSDAWLDELRGRCDIVDVVSGYVQLKPKGRRYWGLCPFHREKSPSFSVDSDAQLFYCFGCHKGGTVIHFVMEEEHMEFMEAVKLLAERVHMDVPADGDNTQSDESRAMKQRILDANVAAARFYHKTLWTQDGSAALSYLHKRGLDDSDIRRFGLGSTASGWQALCDELTGQGFDLDTLQRAWLIGMKDGRPHDMFHDRVMFPIINQQGNVLGFGGRVLDKSLPKYMNTSDTPVFNKRNGLYAMNFVRKEHGLKRMLLVEGYMDVVALRRRGIEGVVATLGTALTDSQARLIKRYAPEVWVCYDGDEPGQNAIEKAIGIFQEQNVPCKVLMLPDGLDPDEYTGKYGAEAFNQIAPMDPNRFLCEREKKKHDMATEEGRMQYAIACCVILKKLKNPVEIDMHVKQLMLDTGFDREVLMRQIGVADVQQEREMRRVSSRVGANRNTDNECVRAEKKLVMLLGMRLIPQGAVKPEDFETRLFSDMARMLLDGASPATVLDKVADDERERAASALYDEAPPEEKNALSMAEDCLRQIRSCRVERQIRELEASAMSLPAEGRKDCMEKLAQLYQQQQQLKSGRRGSGSVE